MNFQVRNVNPLSLIIGLAFFILLLGGLFFVAQGIYLILLYLTPIFLIAALIMDYKVILSYGKWLINKFKSNFLSGITWSLITIVGFPVVSAILCFRAWTQYKVRQIEKEQTAPKDEYVDYEIVEEEQLEIHQSYRDNS